MIGPTRQDGAGARAKSLAFLCSSGAQPHARHAAELPETRISCVFVAGGFTWKPTKPLLRLGLERRV